MALFSICKTWLELLDPHLPRNLKKALENHLSDIPWWCIIINLPSIVSFSIMKWLAGLYSKSKMYRLRDRPWVISIPSAYDRDSSESHQWQWKYPQWFGGCVGVCDCPTACTVLPFQAHDCTGLTLQKSLGWLSESVEPDSASWLGLGAPYHKLQWWTQW